MNEPRPANEPTEEAWTVRVQDIGRRLEYPPTPPLAGAVRQRLERNRPRLSPALIRAGVVALIAVVLIILAVPDWRAKAFDFLGIGAVQIVRDEPAPVSTPLDTGFDPAYATTLDAVREEVGFTIPLPAYPPDLGSPDAAYLYPNGIVILVWADADGSQLSLHLIRSTEVVRKHYGEQEIETTVHGQRALWLIVPHIFEVPRPGADPIERLVKGNVLLWEMGGITYRIETMLPMDEAVKIAELIPPPS